MKIKIMLAALFSLLTGGCTQAKPDAGFASVCTAKPYVFGHGGVIGTSVHTGREYFAFSTECIDVDMRPQQSDVDFDDLMSKDGIPLDFHSVIRLQVTDPVKLIRDFGPDWYKANVEAEYRNRVRQSVRKYGMNETAIDGSVVDHIDAEISKDMQSYLKEASIPVKLIAVTIGKANPPNEIKMQRVETATQEQRKNTEDKKKLAEDARMEAESSRASADNAYREAMHLSPEQFLSLEQIKMLRDVCGGGKCSFLVGAGSGVQLTRNVQ